MIVASGDRKSCAIPATTCSPSTDVRKGFLKVLRMLIDGKFISSVPLRVFGREAVSSKGVSAGEFTEEQPPHKGQIVEKVAAPKTPGFLP
jgi:hypothetical protein